MSGYLEASTVNCVGVAMAWKLFYNCVQVCHSPFAMLLLVPGTSALSSFSQGGCNVELNESSPRRLTIDWTLSHPVSCTPMWDKMLPHITPP